VPRSTLHDRLSGSVTKTEQRANGHILTITEEDTLLQWILSLDQHGAAPWPASVQDMANILLSECCAADIKQCVGKNWVYRFISRHEELKTQYLRRYNHVRRTNQGIMLGATVTRHCQSHSG